MAERCVLRRLADGSCSSNDVVTGVGGNEIEEWDKFEGRASGSRVVLRDARDELRRVSLWRSG